MSSVFRLIKKKFQPIQKQLTCTVALNSSTSRSTSFEETKKIKQYALNKNSKTIRKKKTKSKNIHQKDVSLPEIRSQKFSNSNTTYILGEKLNMKEETIVKNAVKTREHNSRILDYLKNLEFRPAIKRKSEPKNNQNIVKRLKANQNSNVDISICYENNNTNRLNDINNKEFERLQDEFFNDLSSNELTQNTKALTASQITSSPISISSSYTSKSLNSNNLSIREKNKYLNHSLEKIRRSVSSPKLGTNFNSTACARNDMSKISLIRDIGPEPNDFNLTMNNFAETLENIPITIIDTKKTVETLSLSVSSSSLNKTNNDRDGGFVRGDPGVRLSTNIKRMFKTVIEHQTSALQTLENFYECQINRIEIERASLMSIVTDEQKKRINSIYDEQLRVLEQRVQMNLKRLVENKVGLTSKPPANLPEKITRKQETITKHIQSKQKQETNRNHHRNRTLGALKASLVQNGMQTNVLPPRPVSNSRQFEMLTIENSKSEEDEIYNLAFRRNFSLPFKQSRQILEQNQNSPQRFVTTSGVVFKQEQETLSKTPINRYSREWYQSKDNHFSRISKMPGLVKNSSKTIEQTFEKGRAAKLTTNTTKVNQAHINAQNDVTHDTACTFLQIPTAIIVTSAGFSQIRKENHPRSSSLIRSEPFVYESYCHNQTSNENINSKKPKVCFNQRQQHHLTARLSDGHLQYNYKISDVTNDFYGSLKPLERVSQFSSSNGKIVSMHETEV